MTLAAGVWEPVDTTIFQDEHTSTPHGVTGEGLVRAELEARLRLKPGRTDEQVNAVLARYDAAATRSKVANPRLRAGLLMLTGTSAEYEIDFVLADTNRRGVPFEPVLVKPLADLGAFAAVSYHPLVGKLQMWFDPIVVADLLEAIALVFAHEALHSSLGGGSGSEEALAMAVEEIRLWQEFLLVDPSSRWTLPNSHASTTRSRWRYAPPAATAFPALVCCRVRV